MSQSGCVCKESSVNVIIDVLCRLSNALCAHVNTTITEFGAKLFPSCKTSFSWGVVSSLLQVKVVKLTALCHVLHRSHMHVKCACPII